VILLNAGKVPLMVTPADHTPATKLNRFTLTPSVAYKIVLLEGANSSDSIEDANPVVIVVHAPVPELRVEAKEAVAAPETVTGPLLVTTAPPMVAAVEPEMGRPPVFVVTRPLKVVVPPWPGLRGLPRRLLADPALAPVSREAWEADVRTLWDDAAFREERYAALALTGHRVARAWQDPSALGLYRYLVEAGAWWDYVDVVAADRVGPILLRHREVVTPVMPAYAVDDHLWGRRTDGPKDRPHVQLGIGRQDLWVGQQGLATGRTAAFHHIVARHILRGEPCDILKRFFRAFGEGRDAHRPD